MKPDFTLDFEETLSVYAHLKSLPEHDFKCLSVIGKMEKYLGNYLDLNTIINIRQYYFCREEK